MEKNDAIEVEERANFLLTDSYSDEDRKEKKYAWEDFEGLPWQYYPRVIISALEQCHREGRLLYKMQEEPYAELLFGLVSFHASGKDVRRLDNMLTWKELQGPEGIRVRKILNENLQRFERNIKESAK